MTITDIIYTKVSSRCFMSKKQAKDLVKDSKQQAQPKATNLSPIPELDMFDCPINRINVSTFNKAKKKLSDFIGIKVGRKNQIFETGHDYEFSPPNDPGEQVFDKINDPFGIAKRSYEKPRPVWHPMRPCYSSSGCYL
jgi:hypothetical protein